jgi:hypothetical protein
MDDRSDMRELLVSRRAEVSPAVLGSWATDPAHACTPRTGGNISVAHPGRQEP